MMLSKNSIAMLRDLVENKLSYMDVADRHDARDLKILERVLVELKALDGGPTAAPAPCTVTPLRALPLRAERAPSGRPLCVASRP